MDIEGVKISNMAYVVWRVLMKKYSKVRLGIQRNPQLLVTPASNKVAKAFDDELWKHSNDVDPQQQEQPQAQSLPPSNVIATTSSSSSASPSSTTALSAGPEDIITINLTDIETGNNSNGINRVEVRRSKSRVRSYLRRCKEALIGQQHEDTCPITHHEAVSQSPTTSWYLDVKENEFQSSGSVTNETILSSTDTTATVQIDDDNNVVVAVDQEKFTLSIINDTTNSLGTNVEGDITTCPDDVIETTTSGNSHSLEECCSVANLVDRYLGHLYPDYADHTRPVLVRQARDLLVCTFHGNLTRFEDEYLAPGAKLIEHIKKSCSSGSILTWQKGWPLSVSGALVLHLGALDESLVRHQDIYICIKPGENSPPQLCAVWHSSKTTKIIYHPLDPDKDSLSPLAIEMLAEELPQLLQSLLVGVERVISRIPLDDLTFPSSKDVPQISPASSLIRCNENCGDDSIITIINPAATTTIDTDIDGKVLINSSPNGSPRRVFESGIKRRELITKNKMLNNKYALLRATKSETDQQKSNNNSKIEAGNGSDVVAEPITMPLFCLGGSFPHIDSDEESGDEMKKTNSDESLPHDIVAPRSIQDLPEKLLISGIHLPGTRDKNNTSIVLIEAQKLLESGVNCYEVATVLLYYSTIPTSPIPFTIHLVINESKQLTVLELLDNSLQLLHGHVAFSGVIVSGIFELSDKQPEDHLPASHIQIKYCSTESLLLDHMTLENVLNIYGGQYEHNQLQWREFFTILEPLQSQCIVAGKKLVSVMADVRNSDQQGVPLRRQLYSQHRALTRALMDDDLKNLRKKGLGTINRLQEKAKRVNNKLQLMLNKNKTNIQSSSSSSSSSSSATTTTIDGYGMVSHLDEHLNKISNNPLELRETNKSIVIDHNNIDELDHITVRLNEVVTIFNEVDRAAQRLENVTEQRREQIRELARQKTLENEINEVLTWIRNDGDESLTKYTNVQLECGDVIKDHEKNFEKFYFISVKHLAKGRDLHEATIDVESLKDNSRILKQNLRSFSEKLELTRERIEGAARLHHLLGLHLKEDDVQQEMQKLAEKIGVPALIERCKEAMCKNQEKTTEILISNRHDTTILQPLNATSTPDKSKNNSAQHKTTAPLCNCWIDRIETVTTATGKGHHHTILPLLAEEADDEHQQQHQHQHQLQHELHPNQINSDVMEEDEEEHSSKMADSGLGGCDRCEGNDKLVRACSCQSFEDATIACAKSNNSDDLEEDCFETTQKPHNDLQAPFQPNSHLHCHSSNLNLFELEDDNGLDQKTKKTLLLIMREMIGTERDYVRSLHYIIENYTQEVMRDDIPQALRGQRNVIFGNVERIYEFHQQYFLEELESYEKNPLKVGAAFLRHESKFYLYALYNKNKPKSDSLMSEYGTTFFKSKQLELNDKMDLGSYLLKPVQRMGKYALLLQQLMKACSNVQGSALQYISEDIEELQKAEEMVRFQLRHGNDLLAMDSLRDCDVNVKEQGRLLRQNEFLVWQGRGGKKSLRQVFLFEDLVLFSKARRFPDRKNLDLYIYKHSIKTSDIGLTAHVGDFSTKFEIWFRKRKPEDTWTLQSMSEDIKNVWTDEVSRLLWQQARRNREIRLAEMSSMGIGNKPCLDIRPSQNQINDRSISFSQLGKAPKFRNSFTGTLPEIKSARRPNSIISVSSMSSGTSSSSVSTSAASCNGSSSSSGSNGIHNRPSASITLELVNETVTTTNNCNNRKHHRSTTLVSQCSMESGIIADISMTPEEINDTSSNWTDSLKKSSSTASSTSSNDNKLISNDQTAAAKNNSNPYITDSITVHL